MSITFSRFEELTQDEKLLVDGGSNAARDAAQIAIGVTLVVAGFFAVMAAPVSGPAAPKVAISGFKAIGYGLNIAGGGMRQ